MPPGWLGMGSFASPLHAHVITYDVTSSVLSLYLRLSLCLSIIG